MPLQVKCVAAVVMDGGPRKLAVELNYYVDNPDGFGPAWMLSLNVTPAVKHGLVSLFGL